VHLDACAVKDGPEFAKMILTNVRKFREMYVELRNLPINVVTETNARFDGDAVRKILTHDANWLGMSRLLGRMEFFRDDNLLRDGIVKTIPRTKMYILKTQFALQDSQIRVHQKLSTANEVLSPDVLLRQMKTEMSNFRWPDVDADNVRLMGGRVKRATGKIGGRNDDLAIALQMLVYFAQVSMARRLQAEQEDADRRGVLPSVMMRS